MSLAPVQPLSTPPQLFPDKRELHVLGTDPHQGLTLAGPTALEPSIVERHGRQFLGSKGPGGTDGAASVACTTRPPGPPSGFHEVPWQSSLRLGLHGMEAEAEGSVSTLSTRRADSAFLNSCGGAVGL